MASAHDNLNILVEIVTDCVKVLENIIWHLLAKFLTANKNAYNVLAQAFVFWIVHEMTSHMCQRSYTVYEQ